MDNYLRVLSAGPSITIQDRGRPGYARFGLSAGGAMDRFALREGEVLLSNQRHQAAIEMAGYGGRFQLSGEARWIALTGAEMQATIEGKTIQWRTGYLLQPEQTLEVGGMTKGSSEGCYGYLHIAGGIEISQEIGASGTHLRAGIGGLNGGVLTPGTYLPLGDRATGSQQAQKLPTPPHLGQRRIRIVWGPHTERFQAATRERLLQESFQLSHRRDRMAMRLELGPDQAPFEALLTGLSDPVQDGDIQIAGDGVPAILVREHQPTGGYPRIATVISADLAAVAQIPSRAPFQFELVSMEQAVEALAEWRQAGFEKLAEQTKPVIRSPEEISDLLQYNLIDGVVSARDTQ